VFSCFVNILFEISFSAWGSHLKGVVLCIPLVVICICCRETNESFTFKKKKKKLGKSINK
jgi:hypothetical protein